MPELPEVETVKRQLEEKLQGKEIASIEILSDKQIAHVDNYEEILIGKVFDKIARRGKLLIFSFRDESDLFLLGHLKMTGQLIYHSNTDQISGGGHLMNESDTELPSKHTRLIFNFTDDSVLYFNDLRKFGYLKIANETQVQVAVEKFGPEPIDKDFDCEAFYESIHRSTRVIKSILLDQSMVAGLGNIYVDEVLYRSAIIPTRRANKISKKESQKLCQNSREVLEEAISMGGTTFRNYVDTDGEHGNFTDYLLVFGKEGTECPQCGTKIEKIKVAGRGTHYCPYCQN